jgi:hypothetical protein
VRRFVGVAAGIALVLTLGMSVARASVLPSVQRVDLGSQLMLSLFGETSDERASFDAAHGDRASESPLRELALAVPVADTKRATADGAPAFAEDRLALRDLATQDADAFPAAAPLNVGLNSVHFSMPAPSTGDEATLVPPTSHYTAAYQPVAPLPAISPEPGTLAFMPPQISASEPAASTAQVGAIRFHSQTEPNTSPPQLGLQDAAYGAGANFDVRAGKRNVSVNLSSEYEHVGRNSDTFSVAPLDTASSWQLPGAGAPLLVPNYADLNRLSVGAGVSVPVVRGLTLNLNYDAQHLYGGYGLPGLVNLDTINNTYGGNLTFTIPRISSSLSIGAYQDRFQDGAQPLNGLTQTREDVNFTVKF